MRLIRRLHCYYITNQYVIAFVGAKVRQFSDVTKCLKDFFSQYGIQATERYLVAQLLPTIPPNNWKEVIRQDMNVVLFSDTFSASP